MSNLNKNKGGFGEKVVSKWLENKGYKVFLRNWTCHWGEIDLIALDGPELVFVEVKLRNSTNYGFAHESINFYKKKHLFRSINMFLYKYNLFDMPWRLDLVTLQRGNVKSKQKYFIEHYQSVLV